MSILEDSQGHCSTSAASVNVRSSGHQGLKKNKKQNKTKQKNDQRCMMVQRFDILVIVTWLLKDESM